MSDIGFPGGETLDPRLSLRSHERPNLLSPDRVTGASEEFIPHQVTAKACLQAAGGELVPVVVDDDMGVLVTIDRRVLEKQSFPDLEGLGRREGCL